jgi:hypothetical protein
LAVRWWGRLTDEEKQSMLSVHLPSFDIKRMDYETMYWVWLKNQ